MARYASHVATATQTEQAHSDQKKNSAGGYAFTLDIWKRLDRFLILGAEGGTYYVSERALTRDNAKVIIECAAEDPARTVARIVEVSDRGLAPKNDPAIFALALVASAEKPEARAMALAAIPKVCRIGTHLFHFVDAVNQLRGWGPALRRAISRWYTDRSPDQLAYQVVKYQQRDKWSHHNVLELAHARAETPGHHALFRWIAGATADAERTVLRGRRGGARVRESKYGAVAVDAMPKLVTAYELLKKETDTSKVPELIREHGFTHEMVPNEHKASAQVWEALIEKMPLGAMVRNLGKMTSINLLVPMSEASKRVAAALVDKEQIRKARLHPIALLSALRVYAQGHGDKGSLNWAPDPKVIDALDAAFYLAFETIEPIGKPMMLALDVSGSMGFPNSVSGIPGLTARDVSAAMAMATLRTENDCMIFGFSDTFKLLKISARQRLDDVVAYIGGLPFERTDCSLPMEYAIDNKLHLDGFVVYTDNETYAGRRHPHVAIEDYRSKSGRSAKLVVCATSATPFTIANPNDAGMLDVAGFSSDVPAVLANFFRE